MPTLKLIANRDVTIETGKGVVAFKKDEVKDVQFVDKFWTDVAVGSKAVEAYPRASAAVEAKKVVPPAESKQEPGEKVQVEPKKVEKVEPKVEAPKNPEPKKVEKADRTPKVNK